jgi:hypothetical protein
VISHEIKKKNLIFTKCHHDKPKPNDNVWIGVFHTYFQTLWYSHPEYLHDDRMRFIKMMDQRNDKKDHYGLLSAKNELYQRNNDRSGKRPSQAHTRDAYQVKRNRG